MGGTRKVSNHPIKFDDLLICKKNNVIQNHYRLYLNNNFIINQFIK